MTYKKCSIRGVKYGELEVEEQSMEQVVSTGEVNALSTTKPEATNSSTLVSPRCSLHPLCRILLQVLVERCCTSVSVVYLMCDVKGTCGNPFISTTNTILGRTLLYNIPTYA